MDEAALLNEFCGLSHATLSAELLRCCGSTGWVAEMLKRFPFTRIDTLLETATTVWWNLPTSEWRLAFTAHPQIGENCNAFVLIFNLSISLLVVQDAKALITSLSNLMLLGDAAALKSKFAHSKWEGDEQKGANAATAETLQQLADLNAQYLKKNGFIFLICATGKTAEEMVAALQYRMQNDSATEVTFFLPTTSAFMY
jgi:2-oxo-4-hydroxy-4-carboxy-5-ureidoimidazoline decarboxylase